MRSNREGANREKLTVKKLIDNEMFFFTVYVPYKPWKIGVNREKIGTKPWKNRLQKSTIFSPLVFHRLRLLEFNEQKKRINGVKKGKELIASFFKEEVDNQANLLKVLGLPRGVWWGLTPPSAILLG